MGPHLTFTLCSVPQGDENAGDHRPEAAMLMELLIAEARDRGLVGRDPEVEQVGGCDFWGLEKCDRCDQHQIRGVVSIKAMSECGQRMCSAALGCTEDNECS
jgi:hypothetical protein